jgi:molybdopterin-guanine dinucleotide biosynthesis protein A
MLPCIMTGVSSVGVFILAGGRSTRMGTDKALLTLNGKTLLEHALSIAHELSDSVKVVAAGDRYSDFGSEVVEDEFPHCGPLGGIHAALGASDRELNIILSVDTPMVTVDFLRYLLQRATAKPDALVTVPNAAGGVQGTCAVYRRPFRAVAEQQLKRERYKVTEAYTLVSVEYVEEDEMRAAGFDPAMFANLNTPEEFSRVQEATRA